jgi:hypothetical protein
VERREAEHIEIRQQRAVQVVGTAHILNLPIGPTLYTRSPSRYMAMCRELCHGPLTTRHRIPPSGA